MGKTTNDGSFSSMSFEFLNIFIGQFWLLVFFLASWFRKGFVGLFFVWKLVIYKMIWTFWSTLVLEMSWRPNIVFLIVFAISRLGNPEVWRVVFLLTQKFLPLCMTPLRPNNFHGRKRQGQKWPAGPTGMKLNESRLWQRPWRHQDWKFWGEVLQVSQVGTGQQTCTMGWPHVFAQITRKTIDVWMFQHQNCCSHRIWVMCSYQSLRVRKTPAVCHTDVFCQLQPSSHISGKKNLLTHWSADNKMAHGLAAMFFLTKNTSKNHGLMETGSGDIETLKATKYPYNPCMAY